MILRVYWRQRGEHVGLQIWAGHHENALHNCGDLVLTAAEFMQLYKGNYTASFFEMAEEDRHD